MLTVEGVTKTYPNGFLALDRVNIRFAKGRITAILGGSGCGKSTLLRLLSGLDTPSAGRLALDGSPISGTRAEIGMIFQEPRLMPWLNIGDNVGFGLGHMNRADRAARVAHVLEKVGLEALAGRWPHQLSGGQAQRAAIARALALEPEVLLLDEPFSALDALTRAKLHGHILSLWAETRQTLVIVTHDIDEALRLADHVVVMAAHPGRIHAEIDNPLPRPRDLTDPEVQAFRAKLFATLIEATALSAVDDPEDHEPAIAIAAE